VEARHRHDTSLHPFTPSPKFANSSETIADFEADLKGNLYKIWNRLASGSYFPPAVKAVAIPKKNGGVRILGVPTRLA